MPIAHPVERHREFELVGAHSQIGARHRHASTVARQLELRRGGPQRREIDVAVRENEDASTGHATVNATRHLENLVGAEVHAGQHVAATVDDIRESRVVNDDRIQALNIERTLPCRRHREQVRFLHGAFEKRANHADGFPSVIELRGDPLVPRSHGQGRFLDPGARRQEHTHPATLAHHVREEFLAQELQRVDALDLNVGCLRRVECRALHDAGGIEIPGIESWIHRRGQPDEPASDTFAQREAKFQFRARLMNLIHYERVLRPNVVILKPSARDAGGDDDHVPRW